MRYFFIIFNFFIAFNVNSFAISLENYTDLVNKYDKMGASPQQDLVYILIGLQGLILKQTQLIVMMI